MFSDEYGASAGLARLVRLYVRPCRAPRVLTTRHGGCSKFGVLLGATSGPKFDATLDSGASNSP